MRVESGSSLSVFRDCPARYKYQVEERLNPPGYSRALGFGDFVHKYRAIFHAKRVGAEETIRAQQALDSLRTRLCDQYRDRSETLEEISFDETLARHAVDEWSAYWQVNGDQFCEDKLDWQEIEKEWSIPILGQNQHVGIRDGYVRHRSWDKYFLYELKTSKESDQEAYRARLQLDHQISSNLLALRTTGYPSAGVLYDIIWKPDLRRGTNRKTKPDESLDEFMGRMIAEYKARPAELFERKVFYRTDAELDAYLPELEEQFKGIITQEIRYKNTSACKSWGSLCPFFQLCCNPESQEVRAQFNVRDQKLAEFRNDHG
jgi:hypothetical protein